MTPETKADKQNPILKTFKRTVGIEEYLRTKDEIAKAFPRDRINQVLNNVSATICQIITPVFTEYLKVEGESSLPKKHRTISKLAVLLDIGLNIGTILLFIDRQNFIALAAGKIGYNLGVGALNESLKRMKQKDRS